MPMESELQVMGLNIAICDDEKIIREQIKELAEKEMPDVCARLYETGDALLAAGKQFDIVFLDIQMEGTDGIETAKRLRQREEDTILIFITGIREYVFEAFDVAAFHYLLKPIEEDKFREVFHRAGREPRRRIRKEKRCAGRIWRGCIPLWRLYPHPKGSWWRKSILKNGRLRILPMRKVCPKPAGNWMTPVPTFILQD